jgi:hypothetical protein
LFFQNFVLADIPVAMWIFPSYCIIKVMGR